MGPLQDPQYWGDAFERSKVPTAYLEQQPETNKWAEPEIILMFKLPSYEWLVEKVSSLKNKDLRLTLKT